MLYYIRISRSTRSNTETRHFDSSPALPKFQPGGGRRNQSVGVGSAGDPRTYYIDVEMQCLAQKIAEEFNKRNPPKQVSVSRGGKVDVWG